ncbi:MAG: type II toxin-antitoxin system YafQ family toxin [Synergistaceae bacterium]|nr:type II toxin-antitoxin system YafQ family toxin [Synergistaceae bacterium]
MRCVAQSKTFRKDLKRELRSKYRYVIAKSLWEVVEVLANDGVLNFSYHDHALTGDLSKRRECHLAFDLVMIYRFIDDNILLLERLGSHSEVLGL